MSRGLVAGVGDVSRRDDGIGAAVVRAAAAGRAAQESGARFVVASTPLDLLSCWGGVEVAVIVDAIRSGSPPGTMLCVPLDDLKAPLGQPASTHWVGLPEVLRLARALGRAPQTVWLVGVEGADFGPGEGLSPTVRQAVPRAAERVVELLEGRPRCA